MKVVVGSVYVSERVVQSKLGSFVFVSALPCARGQVRSHHKKTEQPFATSHCNFFTCDKLDDFIFLSEEKSGPEQIHQPVKLK